MNTPRPKSRAVNGLDGMRSLLPPTDAAPPLVWSSERLKKTSEVKALVLCSEHANCDSLPLRYGIHFPTNTLIALTSVKFRSVDSTYSDRFHIDAQFSVPGAVERSGHFVVGTRRGYTELVVVTVWCDDANTESRLSEVMTALRKQGFLTPQALLELHPLYVAGELSTSADLIKHLVQRVSGQQVDSMRAVADEALARADTAIAERDSALERARRAEDVALQASFVVDDLQGKNEALTSKVEELEAERQRHQQEKVDAQSEGQTASLSKTDTLIDVLENQMHRGSSCTILVMGDRSRRYMKTTTFDRTGRVTANAKHLIGRRVQVSCWDPVDQPNRWSREGYFRNVYAAE